MVKLLISFKKIIGFLGQTDTPIDKKDRNLNLSPSDMKVII